MMLSICICIVIAVLILPYLLFARPPKPKQTQIYDYILVLGCPANEDGTLSNAQRKRVQAAIYYYRHGYANSIIISGSAVKNDLVEAHIMAQEAQNEIPKTAILTETKARNTYQNMQFTKAQFGGENVLVVSGPSHLRRAYFFARKFYPKAVLGCAKESDPWYYYVWEYTRMWVALYWEIRLHLQNRHSGS